MITDSKGLPRAQQLAQRLAELQAQMDQLNAEMALERSLSEEMATRGLARSRAAVLLYDVVGVGPVRRDDDEKRAQRLGLLHEQMAVVRQPDRLSWS